MKCLFFSDAPKLNCRANKNNVNYRLSNLGLKQDNNVFDVADTRMREIEHAQSFPRTNQLSKWRKCV